MYNWAGSICQLRNRTAWTLPRCITGQPVTQPDTLESGPMYNRPVSVIPLHNRTLARCATGLKYILMITMHSYHYLSLKTSPLPLPKKRCHAVLAHDHASYPVSRPVTQRAIRLCIRTGVGHPCGTYISQSPPPHIISSN